MNIRTIEDNYDYQVQKIIQRMVDDYKDDDNDCNGVNLENWLWENKEELGRYFYESVFDYMGFEEIIEKIEW